MKLIFHATAPMEYRCHPYAIHWSIRGWELWNMSRSKRACLGRELTMSQAIKLAELDAKEK